MHDEKLLLKVKQDFKEPHKLSNVTLVSGLKNYATTISSVGVMKNLLNTIDIECLRL